MENFQTRNKSKTEDFPKEASPVDIKLLELVIVTLRKTIASLHESDPDSIMQYVQRIISSEKVLKLLPKSFQKKKNHPLFQNCLILERKSILVQVFLIS